MELIKIVKTIIDSKPKEENQIILPIETINGMPVIAKITITPNLVNYLFFIDIEADGVDVEEDVPLNFICKFFYEIPVINPVINNECFIESFKKIMNSLRFDRMNGTIEDGEESENNFFREIIDNPNISFKESEQCSVCLEKTKTRTPCDHFLCYICWAKIKEKKCPICRAEII